MTQSEALNILKTGASVFLTGEPGSGKSYTVNQYVAHLRACGVDPAITASTGIAATHIGGMTIHSWSGIGIRTFLDKYSLDKIATSEYIAKRIGRTRVLIIDEVSMLSPGMLDMVDAVCREVKQSDEPFGGMQVILVGDFFQLPPIEKYNDTSVNGSRIHQSDPFVDDESDVQLFSESESQTKKRFAYQSSAWERLSPVVCYLTEQHRQDDQEFLSLLSAIRSNSVDQEHVEHIEKRRAHHHTIPAHSTKLYTHNMDVHQVNDRELGKISAQEKTFRMTSEGNPNMVASLKKGCLSPETLVLKVGASVMCTKNNQREGFVNGTLGTVIGFNRESGYPLVQTNDRRTLTVEPMDWTIEENGKIRAAITQVPLRLAWAITVHKSQGMSLDSAVMDLSGVFEFGQGYVALSRVRRLSGLYILGINDQALRVHPDILESDTAFREQSNQAQGAFSKLSPAEMDRMHKNFITAIGGTWSESGTTPTPKKGRGPDRSFGKISTIMKTKELVEKRMSIDAMAQARGCTTGTIIGHLEQLHEKFPELSLLHVRPSKKEIDIVSKYIAQLPVSDQKKLSPLRTALQKAGHTMSFDAIRLARLFI